MWTHRESPRVAVHRGRTCEDTARSHHLQAKDTDLKGPKPANSLIWDFKPLELRENKSVVSVTQGVLFCDGSPSN